jgi:DNA-binding MarR family transcriptional regulator
VSQLNEIIHQPARLRIMSALTALDAGERMDFSTLRNLLELTDGNLGAHLLKLEEAGYVRLQKEFVERKPRTFIGLTTKGRGAFEDHVEELRKILDQ